MSHQETFFITVLFRVCMLSHVLGPQEYQDETDTYKEKYQVNFKGEIHLYIFL